MNLNKLFFIAMLAVSYESMAGYELDKLKLVNRSNAVHGVVDGGVIAHQEGMLDNESLLRCWQRGELIVNETDLKLTTGNKTSDLKFSKKDKKIRIYQYGETFCMYFES